MPEEPYVGPRPFTRRDRDVFFARKREENELFSLITAHPAVLMYSRSGAGKSSLLNARLIPLLEEDGFEALPIVRVRLSMSAGVDLQAIPNLFIFNTLLCLAAGRMPPENLRRMSIPDLLAGDSGSIERDRAPQVIIVDQLEELFTTFPERWRERRGLFEQLGQALEQDRLLRLVLAIREDYIAELDPYAALLPERLQCRFRLEPLREEASLEAVKGPLRGREKKFEPGVAERLVDNLLAVRAAWGGGSAKGEFVEPVQLQVVCLNLWQSLQATDSPTITNAHLDEFGDVDRALSEFYERTILGAAVSHGIKEGVLRRWFETSLITPARTRGAVFQGVDDTGGLPNSAVADLEEEHLIAGQLRGGARWYELSHDRLIEPILESNRRWSLARSGAEQTREHLEAKASRWNAAGRGAGELLDEGELAEAERWLASPDAEELGYTEKLRSYVQASRSAVEGELRRKEMERIELLAEEQRRRGKILKSAVTIVSALLLVLLGLSFYSVAQRREADAARQQEVAARQQEAAARQQEAAARREEQRQRMIAEKALVEVRNAKASVERQSDQLEEALEEAISARLREVQEREIAELARRQALQEKAIAERERGLAQTALAQRNAAESADALQREAATLHANDNASLALRKYEESLIFYRQARNATGEADVLYKIGKIQAELGDIDRALHSFNEALVIYESGLSSVKAATVLLDIGRARSVLGDYAQALQVYKEALEIFRSHNERKLEAVNLATMAMLHREMGNKAEAAAVAEAALQIAREVGDQDIEISALSTLSIINREAGDFQRSLAVLQEALKASQTESQRSSALLNLGVIYYDLGDLRKALDTFTEALPLFRATGDKLGEAMSLNSIGRVYTALGEIEKALESFERALSLQSLLGHRSNEAATLNNLGQLYSSLGEPMRAAVLFEQALAIYRTLADRQGEASTLVNMGNTSYSIGRLEEAAQRFAQAAALARDSSDSRTEAQALYGLAHVERKNGKLLASLEAMQKSVDIVELLRANVVGSDLRLSYSSSTQIYYEALIDILMNLHETDPTKGYDSTAFSVSERYRARSLLETLAESKIDVRQGGDPALLERERQLRVQLNEKTSLRLQLQSMPESVARLAVVNRDIESLTAEYAEVQSLIRAQSPRYAALIKAPPLNVTELQSLLDPETVLLEFALGTDRSFLWVVGRGSVASFTLPPRERIDQAVRRARESLTRETGHLLPMSDLSAMLLGPAKELLTLKRLVIVADGPLAYLPFAALPDPSASTGGPENWPPLVFGHEIVFLPSASSLSALRQANAPRRPARMIAVIADPVFSANDPRVPKKEAADEPLKNPPTEGKTPASALPRFLFARREAEVILALVPPDQGSAIFGFNANRNSALHGELENFRILHFSTHTIEDSEHPELSAIALSMVDQEGRPQDGLVRAYEISQLNLSAELVVLSGSETALGREIRGEGLIGLARSFMYAGVPRVVASLWNVDDRSTAELMSSFYRHMLVGGMTASQALRMAQIEMARSGRWSSPYHWAAFTLQGEWR